MSDDFYPFVDSGDPAPDNAHLTGMAKPTAPAEEMDGAEQARYATRIAIYDDMLSTPRVIVVNPRDVRSYLEEVTNTVYRCMKEQGGRISLMVIREVVENFIHAHFVEPIISILDNGDTVRFADQGPGIEDKERAFEFGVTSADRDKKRYIRGTGAGFPMIQQYLENAGGAVSIEDNLGQGTVVTVTVDAARAEEVRGAAARGAAVRGGRVDGQARPAAQVWPGVGQQVWPGMMPQQPAWQTGAAFQPGWQPPISQSGATMLPPIASQMGTAFQPGWAAMAGAAYPPEWQSGFAQQPPIAERGATLAAGGGIAPQPASPTISERGRLAIGFLLQAGTCGPTDLTSAYGSSNATWSRELEALSSQGLVVKTGQKRVLTDMGRLWAQQNIPQAPIQ